MSEKDRQHAEVIDHLAEKIVEKDRTIEGLREEVAENDRLMGAAITTLNKEIVEKTRKIVELTAERDRWKRSANGFAPR